MAEYSRVTVDENINYDPALPSFPVSVGLYCGFFYGVYGPRLKGYPLAMGMKKFLLPGLVVGGSVGYIFETIVDKYNRRRKAFTEEYISRNPEDFQEQPSQTFGEVLRPWNPVRT